MPRKHLVANQTNKKQQLQAKIWLKLAKEIRAAAKIGGTNVESNSRLKAAVEKALDNNLSRDSIEKNIFGAIKDQTNLNSVTYECYGPSGTQFIIYALTDNQNRTINNLRGYLSKINGQIAQLNSVKIFFSLCGVFLLPKDEKINEDSILNILLPFKVIDIKENNDNYEVLVSPEHFYLVKKSFVEAKFNIYACEIKLVPNEKKKIYDEKLIEKIEKFIDACKNDDDIQSIVHNISQIY